MFRTSVFKITWRHTFNHLLVYADWHGEGPCRFIRFNASHKHTAVIRFRLCFPISGTGTGTAGPVDLLFSEYAEGGSNNRYMELYNPFGQTVSLNDYFMGSTGNAPTNPGQYEFMDTFTSGATIAPGDVYVICDPSADAGILAECDDTTWQYLSNGNDAFCLLKGTTSSYDYMDCIGDFDGDPGDSGWDVCGVPGATQGKTLVRKPNADTVAAAEAAASASGSRSGALWEYTSSPGPNCQCDIFPSDTHDYVGSHTYTAWTTISVTTQAELENAIAADIPHIEMVGDISPSSTVVIDGKSVNIASTKPGLAWFDGGNTRRLLEIKGGSTVTFSGIGFRNGYLKTPNGYGQTPVKGGCIAIDGSNVDIKDAAFDNCQALQSDCYCVSTLGTQARVRKIR